MHFQIQNNEYDNSVELSTKIKDGLVKAGWTEKKDSSNIVCIGGDGTVLRAVNGYKQDLDNLVIYAIHSGGLGFYTDFRDVAPEEIVKTIVNETAELRKFATIDIIADGKTSRVVNEVQLLSPLHPTRYSIEIDGQKLQKFRSTGLIVSTATGSTGAMKSFGGAIIDPKLKAFEIAEIASCSNNVYRSIGSPVVISQDSEIVVEADFSTTNFSGDGHDLKIKGTDKVVLRKGKEITFARHNASDFFERVHRSFVMEGNNE